MRIDRRLIFVGLVVAFVAIAQMPWTGGASAADATPASPAGLTLTFAAAAGPAVDARVARLVALSVATGATPTPMLPPGPFVATWTGFVASPRHIKEWYRFTAEGTGQLKVTVNDQLVLDVTGDLSAKPSELVLLHKSRNKLIVTYRPPASGAASLRLMWARDDHPDYFDPVPPTAFTHDPTDDALVQHGKVRLGRQLLTSMRCIACHQGISGTVPDCGRRGWRRGSPTRGRSGRRRRCRRCWPIRRRRRTWRRSCRQTHPPTNRCPRATRPRGPGCSRGLGAWRATSRRGWTIRTVR
jgi:hypothetical protein